MATTGAWASLATGAGGTTTGPGTTGASGHSISLACEEYALNLPAIETYIGHSIPVSKYNPDALMTDLPKPLRLTRPRTGNGPRRTGAPRNRRRSG